MIYKPFGESGLNLSTLGMGMMRLPTIGGDPKAPIDREKAEEILRYVYDHGVNYFDTAFRYHGGESELVAGEILKQFPRDSYCLATKLPGHMMHCKDGKIGFHGYLSDFHCDSVADIFEDQLKRCQTEYFDFYLLHNVCESSVAFYTNENVGAVEYLVKQRELGRIRHLGFSCHARYDTLDAFLTKYEGVFEFVQIQLNYLDERLQDAKKKYDVIQKHGLPVWVMEGARGGKLIHLPEKAQSILKEVHPEDSTAKWAFRYLQSLPGVQVVLSGMTELSQAVENCEIFSECSPLDEKEKDALNRVVDSMLDLVPCTGCRYCTEECPQGLNIPGLIASYNDHKFADGPLWFNLDPEKESDQPTRCISCGACQSICPQSIDVPAIMNELADKMK
ncbi:MAG: 4Fe-4S dicluster domain-containing protein [Lachnospiraceae bacterium]|nr:4Fe-4S dicluster domain-containing protein [Lachnospiraceae bacterium]